MYCVHEDEAPRKKKRRTTSGNAAGKKWALVPEEAMPAVREREATAHKVTLDTFGCVWVCSRCPVFIGMKDDIKGHLSLE